MGCDDEVPVLWAVHRGPHPPAQNTAGPRVPRSLSLLRIFPASGDSSLPAGLFWTAHLHHSLLGWSRCLSVVWKFWGKKKNPKHKLWVEILTVSLVPWCSPCLICTFHRGCFCRAYNCISPRDCCFVTFCTIVLAEFVLHTVLKKKFHTILCLFFYFFHVCSFPHQSTQRPVIQLFVTWLHLNTDCPFPTLQCASHMAWHV